MEHIHQEEDGIMAVVGHSDAGILTLLGLHGQNHRGKDFLQIVSANNNTLHGFSAKSLANAILQDKSFAQPGDIAIGQVRFLREQSTSPATPIVLESRKGPMALMFSGSVQVSNEKEKLLRSDIIFQTGCEAEILLHLIAQAPQNNVADSVYHVVKNLVGAFCLLVITPSELVVARDRHGFRPFTISKLGTATVFASETCATDLVQAEYESEVPLGQVLVVTPGKEIKHYPFANDKSRAHCSREHIFLARGDSRVFDRPVALSHEEIGKALAKKHNLNAHAVMGMPNAGEAIAISYAQALQLEYRPGLVRNHYAIPRISGYPYNTARKTKVKVNTHLIQSSTSVVIVGNQLLSGEYTKTIVQKIRDAHVAMIALLIASPPTISTCQWGVDIPKPQTLLANIHNQNHEDMRHSLGVDYLGFLTLEDMQEALGNGSKLCTTCFTGNPPRGLVSFP